MGKRGGSQLEQVNKKRDKGDEGVRVIPNHIPSERVRFPHGAEKKGT
jgi:hypothetical protein